MPQGQLFACCPIEPGKRNICVEPAIDSKRNFVIRVEDAQTKRHAFLVGSEPGQPMKQGLRERQQEGQTQPGAPPP